jgi:hypothetical protein
VRHAAKAVDKKDENLVFIPNGQRKIEPMKLHRSLLSSHSLPARPALAALGGEAIPVQSFFDKIIGFRCVPG